MPRKNAENKKAYAELTADNLATLEGLCRKLKEFDLFEALCGRDITERKMYEILWGVYQSYAKNDKTEASTDKRSTLSTRRKQNFQRLKQLTNWTGTDTNSKYANSWEREKEMLEWHLTESPVDIFTGIAPEEEQPHAVRLTC